MKRFAIFTASILMLALMLPLFSVEAVNRSFAEKFASASQDTATSGTYNFDKAHSAIGFRVKHMGLVEVPGYFRDFTGTINYDAQNMTKSSVTFTAKATSVDTGVAPRDKHLRTKDFFEVDTYPDITFQSTKVEKKGKNLMITGNLTMKGVTKQISFPFQIAGFLPGDERSGGKMGATAETVINRRDFNVNYGSNMPNGVPVLSDEIKINLQIEANKPKA